MADPFLSRMADLDAVVAQCRGKGAFAAGIMRDTSNRSNRDGPWWSIQLERTEDAGFEQRRRIAEIRLEAQAPGSVHCFVARWTARVWQGVGTDSFRESGTHSLPWDMPSAADLDTAITALFIEADAAIARVLDERRSLKL
ncbi:hypothetical protein [Sphingomonas sp.]|uniref:hypothetical protein n=1 Tax=Sphingomonas sp. TaxID=28214 RepID=UPI003B3BBCBF